MNVGIQAWQLIRSSHIGIFMLGARPMIVSKFVQKY